MSLTVDQILSAQDKPVEEVPVPEWGGSVFVRRLSAHESIDFVVAMRAATGDEANVAKGRLAASLAAFLCDEVGRPIATLQQAHAIAAKSAAAVNRIVQAGNLLNATDERDVSAVAKNSEPSRADTSHTD
jgi:hypothetical protein